MLAGQGVTADPDTNLVYLGNGRYFDPALGLPLQPNPAGGAPTVPQSLNRYAATSLGPVGVMEAVASGGGIPPALLTTGLSAVSAGSGMGLGYYARNLSGYLDVLANNSLLQRVGYSGLFNRVGGGGVGQSIRFESQLVKRAENRTFRVPGGGDVIDLAYLESQGSARWPVRYPSGEAFVPLNDTGLKRFLRSPGGEFAANFALNLALAIPDLATPWQNPYFNNEQKIVQNGVTVGGVLAGTSVGFWVGNATAVAGLGGPVTFVAVTASGVVVFIAWEGLIKPGISFVATTLGRPDPYQEYRNLKRLGGQP